jgi:hypothetical protein
MRHMRSCAALNRCSGAGRPHALRTGTLAFIAFRQFIPGTSSLSGDKALSHRAAGLDRRLALNQIAVVRSQA